MTDSDPFARQVRDDALHVLEGSPDRAAVHAVLGNAAKALVDGPPTGGLPGLTGYSVATGRMPEQEHPKVFST